jgi:hypothetical protein
VNASTPPIREPLTARLDQPRRGCSIRANTAPPSPSTHNTAPTTSTRRPAFAGVVAGTARRISHRHATTSGRLITKIHRHDATFKISPATSGPSAPAMVPHAVHVPIAGPRSRSGKVATITASELGVSKAPATPWSARNAISSPIEGATAHSREHTPKPATPRLNTRRSPKMSPSDPPSRISEPRVNRYALLTHCWPARPPPRLRWIDGSATLTTLLSRIAMLDPRIVASSVKRFRDAVRP